MTTVVQLPSAVIVGIGAVTPIGRDVEAITAALRQPLEPGRSPRRISDEWLADPAISKQLRRADRFSRMAAIAARDAWNAARAVCANVPCERVGLILSSGFGPHVRGFRFLDGILDCGDTAASPTDFSHSVHGAALAYISSLLGLRGPSINITDFESGFEEAIQLAQCWLAEGACDRVLVGAVEEIGDVMLDSARRLLTDRPDVHPGEGAVFLVLAPDSVAGIACVTASAEFNVAASARCLVIETPPLFASADKPAAPSAMSFTPHFGHCASASAFQLLAGLLLLQSGEFDNARSVRTLSDGRLAALFIARPSRGIVS